MRSMMVAVGLLVAAGSAVAQSPAPPRATPAPGAPAKTVQQPAGRNAPAGLRPSADNEQARRLETERYKRWDDRMRRATRSMCDRC